MTRAPTAAEVTALLAKGPGSNVAVTRPGAADPVLRPRVLPAPRAVVARALEGVIGAMPRWRVAGRNDDVLWATRRTRLFRFVDDVYILLTEQDGQTLVEVRSASRVGRSDLGQNRRNIAELWRGIERFLALHHPPIPGAEPRAVS